MMRKYSVKDSLYENTMFEKMYLRNQYCKKNVFEKLRNVIVRMLQRFFL